MTERTGYEIALRDSFLMDLGNNSVGVITDETLLGATCVCVNGVPNCITLSGIDGQIELDGDIDIDIDNIRDIMKPHEFTLTLPGCYRKESVAWASAAEVLEELARECRHKQDVATLKEGEEKVEDG